MVSPNLTEIGAGVALVGDYVYYVIVAARPTSSRQPQVVSTLAPGQVAPTLVVYAPPLASTAIPNTPEPDGSIYHIVQPGETLWLIAITYNVRVADIRQLNGMSETEAIYPNEELLIVKGTGLAANPEPVLPTDEAAVTPQASATPTLRLPTVSDASLTPTLAVSPTATPEPLLVITREDGPLVLGVIVLAAVVLTLVLARPGRP
jgi:LysM repeat protein